MKYSMSFYNLFYEQKETENEWRKKKKQSLKRTFLEEKDKLEVKEVEDIW